MSGVVDRARHGPEVVVDRDRGEQGRTLETGEERVEERGRGLPVVGRCDHGAAFDARAVEVELREIGEQMRGREHRVAGLIEVVDEPAVDERRALHGHAAGLEQRRSSERERQVGRCQQVFAQHELIDAGVAKALQAPAVEGRIGNPGPPIWPYRRERCREGVTARSQLCGQLGGEAVPQHRRRIDVHVRTGDHLAGTDRRAQRLEQLTVAGVRARLERADPSRATGSR